MFVTFSPDEKHNVLMLRLHRSRENDPIHNLDTDNKQFGARMRPPMGVDLAEIAVTMTDVLHMLPDYDNRRAIVARDGLASVDGFRIAVLMTCQCLFGIRMCQYCPDCNHDRGTYQGCQDIFGNNACAEGGCLGRADVAPGAAGSQHVSAEGRAAAV